MKRLMLIAMLALVQTVPAIDAVMTNTTAKSVSWNVAGNWTDSSGAPLADAPFDAADNVSFKALERPQGVAAVPRQTVTIGTADRSVGTIAGDDRRTIQYTVDATGNVQSEHWLTIMDPSAFLGFWTVGNVFSGLVVPDGSTLSSLSGTSRPRVRVTDADSSAALGTVHEPGTVDKEGAGSLSVGATTGDDTSLIVKDGGIVLEGGLSDDGLAAVLAQSAAHFDASATNTQVRRSADGRIWVDEWTSVSDSTLKARKSNFTSVDPLYIAAAESPFVSPVTSPTGLPLVDFGSGMKSSKGELGPSNCLLELTRTISGIKTVFYVVQGEKGMDCSTVLGSATKYDFIANAWTGMTTLFATGAAKLDVMHGEYLLNARQTSHEEIAADKLTSLHVLSIDLDGTGSASFDLFGSDRYLKTSSGGFRLGEALVFTNHLDRADRLRISRHLVNKWQGGSVDPLDDVGSVRLVKASAEVGVPAARIARIGSIDAAGKAFEKTGAGQLAVDVVTPATTEIAVKEGSLSFDKVLPDVTDGEPADGAYIWLDAHTLSGTEVTTWGDCRASAVTKAESLYDSPRVPTLVASAVGPAVSFGLKSAGNHAAMKFDNWDGGGRQAYAGFIVVRPTVLNSTRNIFGSSYQDMIRDSAAKLVAEGYASTHVVAARWSINGRIVDPLADEGALLNQTNRFVLVGFTSQSPIAANGISQDRSPAWYPDACGGIEVAEMIVYNKRITEAERRQTEAYLMKRWRLGDHPAAGNVRSVGKVSFEGTAEVRIGGERDLTIGKVSGGNGTLVKSGVGALTISEPDPAMVSTVAKVESGSLAITFEPVDLLSRALFRFDASDTAAMTCEYVDNGDGTVTTNVLKWLDANRNGYNARSTHSDGVYNNYPAIVKAHPTLKSVVFPDGRSRPVVDFGTIASTDAAGFSFYNNTTYVTTSKVREIFTVYSDVHRSATACGQIVGSSSNHFLHGPDWGDAGKMKLLLSFAAAAVRNGYIAVDGVQTTADYVPNKEFHVISFGATSLVTGNMMCQDRDVSAGGSQIAEQVAFDFELTAAQRAMVESYLMRKWLGDESRVNTLALGGVELGEGTSFSAGNAALSLPVLRGSEGASVTAGVVTDVATLSVESLDKEIPAVVVEGPVAFADAVCVSVAEQIGRQHEGVYPLLRATSFEGLDLSKWTLSCSVRSGRILTLVLVDGNTIGLKVERPGILVIVR